MNRHGQVLVFFVILIPVFVLLLAFTIDLGYSYYQSNRINSINRMAVKYGLEHINDSDVRSKIISLIYKNDSHINSYNLTINKNTITLKINKTAPSIFGRAININYYYISSEYVGYIRNNKIMIEKGQ